MTPLRISYHQADRQLVHENNLTTPVKQLLYGPGQALKAAGG